MGNVLVTGAFFSDSLIIKEKSPRGGLLLSGQIEGPSQMLRDADKQAGKGNQSICEQEDDQRS